MSFFLILAEISCIYLNHTFQENNPSPDQLISQESFAPEGELPISIFDLCSQVSFKPGQIFVLLCEIWNIMYSEKPDLLWVEISSGAMEFHWLRGRYPLSIFFFTLSIFWHSLVFLYLLNSFFPQSMAPWIISLSSQNKLTLNLTVLTFVVYNLHLQPFLLESFSHRKKKLA